MMAYEYSTEDDIDLIIREICRPFGSIIRRHSIKYHVSFYAIIMHDFTDAHDSRQTLNLNDVHINLWENKQQPPTV